MEERESSETNSHWIKALLKKVITYIKPNPKKKEVKYRIPDLNLPPPPDNSQESSSSLSPNYDKVPLCKHIHFQSLIFHSLTQTNLVISTSAFGYSHEPTAAAASRRLEMEESETNSHWIKVFLNMLMNYIKPNPNEKKKKKDDPA